MVSRQHVTPLTSECSPERVQNREHSASSQEGSASALWSLVSELGAGGALDRITGASEGAALRESQR